MADAGGPLGGAERGILKTKLLEATGEESLEEIRDLTLRGAGLTTIAEHAPSLVSLEVLSLSHNRLSGLEGFSCFKSLQHLNLNFNALESLRGLEGCVALTHCFIANNRVRHLEPLASCPRLQVLNVFRNSVSSLDATLLVMAALPELRELSLDGNPVSRLPDYRDRLCAEIPRLERLDEENVEGGLGGEQLGAAEVMPLGGAGPASPARGAGVEGGGSPRLAPFDPRARRFGPSGAPDPTPLMRPSTAPARDTGYGRGVEGVRLFRDDFLNEHPILLEYLANASLPGSQLGSGKGVRGGTDSRPATPGQPLEDVGGRRSFVARLRSTAAEMNAAEGVGPADPPAPAAGARGPSKKLEDELLEEARNPQEAVRRLVRMCEVLQAERDAAREELASSLAEREKPLSRSASATGPLRGGGPAGGEAERPNSADSLDGGGEGEDEEGETKGRGRPGGLVKAMGMGLMGETGKKPPMLRGPPVVLGRKEAELLAKTAERLAIENKRLRTENKNMFVLLEENKQLRLQLAGAGEGGSGGRAGGLPGGRAPPGLTRTRSGNRGLKV